MWPDSHHSLFFTSYFCFSNLDPQFFLFNLSHLSQRKKNLRNSLIIRLLLMIWWLAHIWLTFGSHRNLSRPHRHFSRHYGSPSTRLRLVDGEITARAPRHYGSCFLTKQCIFCYSSFFYLFIFTFSAKRVFLSKLFCIFALEHRLIVLMGQKSCMLLYVFMASAEARRCDFCG